MQSDDPCLPDPSVVRARFERAAASFNEAAVLHDRVREQLLERLDVVDLAPSVVLDVGAGTGRAIPVLKRRFPKAKLFAIDHSAAMLERLPRTRLGFRQRRVTTVCADARKLPFADGSADVVFSNLCLPWCPDPDTAIAEFRRVLKPRGLLLFSALGPDTLRELRDAWASVDDGAHVHRFYDMHDLGDALVRAGLGEPVMDVERFTLTYPDPEAAMKELAALGARNSARGRSRGLTGRRAFARFIAELDRQRDGGRLALTCEVVFGTAWAQAAPGRRDRAAPGGEIRVAVDAISNRKKNT
ncbi:MAG: malonyl-ACP O-methyltransferase BioC [Pseudomonadota bacterium]